MGLEDAAWAAAFALRKTIVTAAIQKNAAIRTDARTEGARWRRDIRFVSSVRIQNAEKMSWQT